MQNLYYYPNKTIQKYIDGNDQKEKDAIDNHQYLHRYDEHKNDQKYDNDDDNKKIAKKENKKDFYHHNDNDDDDKKDENDDNESCLLNEKKIFKLVRK